jgi:hypothetical protein
MTISNLLIHSFMAHHKTGLIISRLGGLYFKIQELVMIKDQVMIQGLLLTHVPALMQEWFLIHGPVMV